MITNNKTMKISYAIVSVGQKSRNFKCLGSLKVITVMAGLSSLLKSLGKKPL